MNNNSFIVDGIIFHTGDKITCIINGNKIIDAKLYIDEEYGPRAFVCQNIVQGAIAPDTLGYFYSWVFKLYDTSLLIEAHQSIYNFRKAKIECFEGIIESAYPKR